MIVQHSHFANGGIFKDFVGVKPSASQDDINKAFKKKGRTYHPDKVKQSFIASKAKPTKGTKKPGVHVSKAPSEREISKAVKEANARFTRLSLVVNILRGEGRERYDHFLNNGFPKWRGSGYYYARFRPGLVSTLLGLFVFGGGLAHYAALILSWKRQREFVERYIRHARKTAWGDESGIAGVPGLDSINGVAAPPSTTGQDDEMVTLNRRQKRMQEKESKKGKLDHKRSRSARRNGTGTPLETESGGPQGQKKRVQAENGKTLLVDSVGNVYLEEEDDNGKRAEFLLDPNEIVKPTFRQTLVFRLPVWVFETTKARIMGRSTETEAGAGTDGSDSSEAEDEKPTHLKVESASSAARKRRLRSVKGR